MGTISLSIQLFIVFVFTAFLLNKYSNLRKQNAIVTVAAFIGWFFSLIIIFVLPLDVAITFYHKCEQDRQRSHNSSHSNCELPGGYVPDKFLFNLWRIVYWTAQVLTWLILPLLQSYVTAGNFTAFGKLRTAILNNLFYYGLYSVCLFVIFVYALFKGVSINMDNLKVMIVSASNTWGLFLLVVLLGYGLVELPRSLWHIGNRHYRLRKTYFDIEKLASDKSEAEDNVKEIYKKVLMLYNACKNGSNSYKDKISFILSKFDDETVQTLFPSRQAIDDLLPDKNYKISEAKLVNLNKNAISKMQALNNASAQWRELVDRALFLENLAFSESQCLNLQLEKSRLLPISVRRFWYSNIQTPLSKILGCLFFVMTFFILISECTFFVVSPTLSPAALVTEYAANRFHYKYTQFVAFAIILYLCSCAYFTIFRLQIYKYYHLDPNGHTNENSILFSAILLCRLTPPICLNFLGMIHMDSHVSLIKGFGVETQFTKLMGHLDIIPILAKGINIYLPICIILFCVIHYYRFGTYLLHAVGFDQFVEADEMTNDMINSGRSLVQIERNSLRRSHERKQRSSDKFWKKQSGGVSSKKHRYQKSYRKEMFDEEQPMLADDEGDDDGSNEFSTIPLSNSAREHPSSSGFFDDM